MKQFTFSNFKMMSILYVIVFSSFSGILFAQNAYNISGTYEGLRLQYDKYQKDYEKEFQYQFDLTQKDNQIEGISTIYNNNGDYAEVKLKGMIVGDKFYFEEYEIVDEMKEEYSTWCYKVGVLDIVQKDGEIWLMGKTPSYMANYGYACTGGYTKLSKIDDKIEASDETSVDNVQLSAISLYPNPVKTNTTLSYSLDDKTKVSIDVYDISGKLISNVITEKKDAGAHQTQINTDGFNTGFYIVKLTAGKTIHSEQIIKLAD